MGGWKNNFMHRAQIQKLIAPYLLPPNKSYVLLFVDGVFVVDLIPEQTLTATIATISATDNKVCITIVANIILPVPIHMLFLTTQEPQNGKLINWENKIIAGMDSKITIVEEHILLNDVKMHPNVTTTIQTKSNAQVLYYKIFNAVQARHTADLQLNLSAASEIKTYHVILGGAELKEKISAKLDEPHAVCDNRGLYVLKDNQKMDLNIAIEHVVSDCTTKVLFKGIAADEAQASFSGKIMVGKGAQHSKARLDNKNLLLHDTARITTSPALEIYADDVKCSHGATVGQLDAQALWYLQSRGINPLDAKKILIQAFLQEIISMLPDYLQAKISLPV